MMKRPNLTGCLLFFVDCTLFDHIWPFFRRYLFSSISSLLSSWPAMVLLRTLSFFFSFGLVLSNPINSRTARSLSVRTGGIKARDGFKVKKWAALGDSYASGLGAGVRGSRDGDVTCSRYTESYPNVANVVLDNSPPADRQFFYTACSGSVSTGAFCIPKKPDKRYLLKKCSG